MGIKAVDIAKKLNISKATVSLALNNKPGVSDETRKKILQCMEELSVSAERGQEIPVENPKKMIKVIVVDNKLHIGINSEMDLWSDVYALIEKEVKKLGYTLGITFIDYNPIEIMQAVEEANDSLVAGVILNATEMQPEQLEPFRNIRKPMVIYDNDLGQDYNCIVIDGVTAVRECVDYLVDQEIRNICYLANSENIYNFRQRRSGFRAGLRKHHIELREDSIVYTGSTIAEVYQTMKKYIDDAEEFPDAFIMENYQVSIGTIRALREKNIQIPEEISLIGIDELPEYLTGDIPLTMVKVVHEERAKVLVMFLEEEIKHELSKKYKVLANCKLIKGESVKVHKKI